MNDYPPEAVLFDVLAAHARRRGSAPAIVAPGWPALTYAALYAEAKSVGAALEAHGLRRGSRVAIALSAAPTTAAALLTVVPWAACALLDVAADIATAKDDLESMRIDALIVAVGADPPAAAAAAALGIPVLRWGPAADGSSDRFVLDDARAHAAATAPSGPADLALLIRTSGSTGTPKIARMTHSNVVASLQLRTRLSAITEADRCLCFGSLFVSTTIMRSLLAPIYAGACVICPGGFRPECFFDWMSQFRPTFFAASPTIYASIIDLLTREPTANVASLRFVSAGGSALPPATQTRLEALLGVPVIQSYGMTETGTIAQNPLPPGRARLGSVGRPAIDVAILGEANSPLPCGQAGEIVVRGPSVIAGYEGDVTANASAFVEGWFRTGDLGYLDDDGYLFITGRIKHLINRGGRKVSPLEIESVLMQHPEVAEAAVCAVAHATLGEDIIAAVVLRAPSGATSQQVRDHALARLAPHKVPTQVLVISHLPKTASGKIDRRQLAIILEPVLRPDFVAPRDAREVLVANLFAEVLGLSVVGAHDNFFDLGGDSLRATQIGWRVYALLGIEVNPATLFRRPTVDEFAAALRALESVRGASAAPPALAPRRDVPADGEQLDADARE